MSRADSMSANIEKHIISERDCASTQLHKERAQHSMQSAKLREKLQLPHTKDMQSHSLTIEKINAKISVLNNECVVSLLE